MVENVKKSSTPQSSNEIYIIGTDIAEANVLRQGDYLITLRKIADKYPNKNLYTYHMEGSRKIG
ncbi:hypothetical protein R8G61_01520 [Tenacibaculum maritimum]